MAQRDEPRPVCPECGRVVHPETAVPFGKPRNASEVRLVGIYCSSRCALIAYRRGFPAGVRR